MAWLLGVRAMVSLLELREVTLLLGVCGAEVFGARVCPFIISPGQGSVVPENQIVSASRKFSILPVVWFSQQNSSKECEGKVAVEKYKTWHWEKGGICPNLAHLSPIFLPISNQLHTFSLHFLEWIFGNFSQFPISPRSPPFSKPKSAIFDRNARLPTYITRGHYS